MDKNRPIGVFDSGVGGLTVVSALTRHLPNEEILYLGDTARLPYGTKSKDTVTRYTRRNVDFLVGRGVKAVVVACNTATALALDDLRVDLPLWGVVGPGARAAAAAGDRGPIGVLATESTVDSGAYERAIRALLPEATLLFAGLSAFRAAGRRGLGRRSGRRNGGPPLPRAADGTRGAHPGARLHPLSGAFAGDRPGGGTRSAAGRFRGNRRPRGRRRPRRRRPAAQRSGGAPPPLLRHRPKPPLRSRIAPGLLGPAPGSMLAEQALTLEWVEV